MKRLAFAIFWATLVIPTLIFAQPLNRIGFLDFDYFDQLYDLYSTSDGGYVACGLTNPTGSAIWYSSINNIWVVKVDENLQTEWSNMFGLDSVGECGFSVIEVDAGGYLVGGATKRDIPQNFTAWRIEDNGELVWTRSYGLSNCNSVIELKAGSYLLAGQENRGADPWRCGVVVCINDRGEQLWRTEYTFNDLGLKFEQMRETQSGVIIVGNSCQGGRSQEICVFKIDPEQEGEVIWSNGYEFGQYRRATSIVADNEGGFIIVGDVDHDWLFFRINERGDVVNRNTYDGISVHDYANSVERITPDQFAVIGYYGGQKGLLWLNRVCEVIQFNSFSQCGDFILGGFQTAVRSADGALAIGGTGHTTGEDAEYNGFIMEFGSVVEEPQFFRWSPEDTVFTVLLDEEVTFSAYAEDQQGDALNYLWTMNDSLIARNDTSYTILFDSLGVFAVRILAFDGNNIASVTWRVTVDDFFLRSTSPDSSDLTFRRNSIVPFALDVACIEPNAWWTRWTMVDRNLRRHELGEGDSLDILFDLAGNCRVEALVEWQGQEETTRWNIAVRSAVWWWNPHLDSVTVYLDSSQVFNVVPFNQDSDSLGFEWRLDGEDLEWDQAAITVDFVDGVDVGGHELTAVCRDGVEADTIEWVVNVIDGGGIFGLESALPTEPKLYPPAPNPFNSRTRIEYYLPRAGRVSLRLYDLSGREVLTGMDRMDGAGRHSVTLDAAGLPAGVYIAALRGEGFTQRVKVAVVK